MKKFKGLKKVTALALCGIMCLGSTMSASAAVTKTKAIVSSSNDLISTTKLYRDSDSFYANMVIEKDYAGRNICNGIIDLDVRLYNDEMGVYTWDTNPYNKVYAGYTSNAYVGKTYTTWTIRYVIGTLENTGYDPISVYY